MGEWQPLLDAVRTASVVTLLAIILIGGRQRWWIWGHHYDELRADRDEMREERDQWRNVALEVLMTGREAVTTGRDAVSALKQMMQGN